MAIEWLVPDGDGTTGSWTTTPLWSKIDDYSTVDGSFTTDGSTITSPNNASGNCFVTLDATASTFNGSVTLVRVKITKSENHVGVSGSQDSSDLFVQIFKSDETTSMTSEVQVGTGTQTDQLVTLTASGSFTKTDWDGARLRLRHAYTVQGCNDTTTSTTVTAVAVALTYTSNEEKAAAQSHGLQSAFTAIRRRRAQQPTSFTYVRQLTTAVTADAGIQGDSSVTFAPRSIQFSSVFGPVYTTGILSADSGVAGETGTIYPAKVLLYSQGSAPVYVPAAVTTPSLASWQSTYPSQVRRRRVAFQAAGTAPVAQDASFGTSYPDWINRTKPRQQPAAFIKPIDAPAAGTIAGNADAATSGETGVIFQARQVQYASFALPVLVPPSAPAPNLSWTPTYPSQFKAKRIVQWAGINVIPQDAAVSVSYPDELLPRKRAQQTAFFSPTTLIAASSNPGNADAGVQGESSITLRPSVIQIQALTGPVFVPVIGAPSATYPGADGCGVF